MEDLSFPKSLRLTGKKEIDLLFKDGSSRLSYPFRILKLKSETPKIMFTVPSRTFRKATDRNRIRRLMREAWRLNRKMVGNMQPMLIAYIYTAKEILPYKTIADKMVQSFRHLREKNEES